MVYVVYQERRQSTAANFKLARTEIEVRLNGAGGGSSRQEAICIPFGLFRLDVGVRDVVFESDSKWSL